jgi:hypothetical protein
MSSWVAPTIAAEILNLPLADVLAMAKSGKLPSRQEDGFLFVDVHKKNPPTSTELMLTPEEEEALFEPISFVEARKISMQARRRPLAA